MSRLIILLLSLAALAFHASVGFAVADYALNRGVIHYGVQVYGRDVSGLTRKQAESELEPLAKAAAAKSLMVKDKKGSWPVEKIFLKAEPKTGQGVSEAYALGRQGGYADMLLDRLFLYFKPAAVVIPSKVNTQYAGLTADKVAGFIDIPAVDATVEITGETAKVRKAKNGWAVDKPALKKSIADHAADFSTRVIKAPQGVAYVKIHDEDAEKALRTTLKMIKDPIDYTINGRDYTISSGKIGALITFVPEKQQAKRNGKKTVELGLKPVIDKTKLEQYFIPIRAEFEVPAVNARFEAGEGVVTIIPGVNGLVIDLDSAARDLNKLALKAPPRKAALRMKEVEPELSTAKAEAMGIKERVSVHTEYFEFTPNRSQNIGTLAIAINGMIVAPGQVWSINEATGPRTAAKGYTEAPVIVNGQLSPDIGGGICNVSTTIFNTAFFGGYEIVERYAHDFYISHYPDGRDASIYYDGGMDFRFKNDSPYYILIITDHTESSITVAFYSTNMGTDVTYTDTGFTSPVPYGITYKDEPGIPTGWEKDGDMGYGVDGRDITVFRTVKRGGQVYREDKFASHYEPKQRIVLKGTGPALPPGTPPPADLRPFGQTPR